MSPRTTAILALVAAALGAFVWFHEIEGEVAREEAAADGNRVFSGLAAEDVETIELTTLDGEAARFERRSGRWWVVAPVEGPAEASALDAMASALTDLPKAGSVRDVRSPADFGLGRDETAPGGATSIIRFEAGGTERGLRVGRDTPVGGHRYVAPLASDDVAFVESFRVNAFRRNLDDLRDRGLFDLETDALRSLVIEAPETAFRVALERDAEGDWHGTAPFEGPADPERLREIVSNLAYLQASGFVDEPERVDDAARSAIARRIRWTEGGDGEAGRPRVLTIAGRHEGGRLVARDDGRFFTVAEERLADFPAELDAYRWKRLARFDLDAATRLAFHFVEPAADRSEVLDVIATRSEAGWESVGRSLDDDAISGLVRLLSNLEADGLLAEALGDDERAALGFVPPRAVIRVEGEARDDDGTPVLAELRFGRFDPGRGLLVERGAAAAADGGPAGGTVVYRIDAALAEGLPYTAERFRAAFEGAGDATDDAGVELDEALLEVDPDEGAPGR